MINAVNQEYFCTGINMGQTLALRLKLKTLRLTFGSTPDRAIIYIRTTIFIYILY